jgi:hypothetical protein
MTSCAEFSNSLCAASGFVQFSGYLTEAQMYNGKVSVDLGDIPGVKHSIRMTKDNKDWEAWYGMRFQQEFTERMGFEPTEECIRYALEKYAEIAD